MKNVGKSLLEKSRAQGKSQTQLMAKAKAAKAAKSAPATTTKPAPAPTTATTTPAMQKKKMVSKKTAYDIKQASNQKLTAGARKHYAMNAQAAMKNQKKK